jgi:hypothetical protein
MKMTMLKCAVAGLALGLTGAAWGQAAVYGQLTAAKMSAANTAWMYGPTVGLYYDYGHGVIATGFDVRGTFLGRGNTTGAGSDESFKAGLVGVRAAVTPHVLPFKPYAEALGGFGSLTAGQGASRTSATHFTYQFLGGLDFTFFPRVDWRVVEFSYGRLSGVGDSFAPKSLSTGLVFRLP